MLVGDPVDRLFGRAEGPEGILPTDDRRSHVERTGTEAALTIPVVQLESGAVLLAPLDVIKKTLDLARSYLTARMKRVVQLATTREDRLAEIGAAMIGGRGRWDESALDPDLVKQCADLLGRADSDDAHVNELKQRPHGDVAGLLHWAVDSVRERSLEGDERQLAAQARLLLIQLAQTHAGGALDEVRRDRSIQGREGGG